MTQYQSHDIDKIFGKRHLSFTILTDLSCFVLPNPKYQEILKRLGFDIRETDQYNPINEEDYRNTKLIELINKLKEKYERYKELVNKKELTDEDFEEIAELELFLNEIPDYLALDISTEYKRIKMEFESREDI